MSLKSQQPIDDDILSAALHSARIKDKEMTVSFGHRVEEVDKLEDEIIKNYTNNHNIKLSSTPSLVECQMVMNSGQAMLNRITEIETQSIRIKTKITAIREAMLNGVLVALGSNGSAESRKAKAASVVESMNLLIALEEGLSVICDTVRRNVKNAIECASRCQSAITDEVKYLGGAEVAQLAIADTRKAIQNNV